MRPASDEPPSARAPALVDTHVGSRIRLRRRVLGLSQQQLAEAIGLTFQQVQKYELGKNRVSASKLYDIAGMLAAPVAYFFEGLPHPEDSRTPSESAEAVDQLINGFLGSAEGLELARRFMAADPNLRRGILSLLRDASASAPRPGPAARPAPPAESAPARAS